MSVRATCVLLTRCPAWRRREHGLGVNAERGNLGFDTATTVDGERETSKRQKPQGAEYRCGAQGRTTS
jgi:hypothetical protein